MAAPALAAAAPYIIKGVATLGSAALSAFGGKSDSNSANDFQTQKSLMDYQALLNRQDAYMDYLYNTDYMKQQFKYNKWFTQNQYQNTMQDLQNAGLNPLLAISNGANSAGSVGSQSSHTNGTGLLDPASMVSARAQELNSKLGIIGAINNTLSSLSQSAKAFQEAKTEENKRHNLDMDSSLKNLQGMRQIIENSNLDEKMKSEIKDNITKAELNLTEANYKNAILPYVIQEKSASAKSMLQNADSNSINAFANKFSATTERIIGKYNAETNRLNAKTNRENAKTNRENAKSRRIEAHSRSIDSIRNIFRIF